MAYRFYITSETPKGNGVVRVHATIKGLGLDERGVYVEDIVRDNDHRGVYDVELVSYTDGQFNVKYFVIDASEDVPSE